MKANECNLSAVDVSAADQGELDKLVEFAQRRQDHPEETVHQAYAEVFGDVVFKSWDHQNGKNEVRRSTRKWPS